MRKTAPAAPGKAGGGGACWSEGGCIVGPMVGAPGVGICASATPIIGAPPSSAPIKIAIETRFIMTANLSIDG
ncbi:MAG: hypothetical protein B7X48_09535 [Acidiphilium sp. 34-60-192]|nr:MAG: hypothetical protein B7X48_09535 [Acidiphilium sp. 34-60-192]